jgi:hypothetical protein
VPWATRFLGPFRTNGAHLVWGSFGGQIWGSNHNFPLFSVHIGGLLANVCSVDQVLPASHDPPPGGLLDRQWPLRRNRPAMTCGKCKVMVLPLSHASVPQGKPVTARVCREIGPLLHQNHNFPLFRVHIGGLLANARSVNQVLPASHDPPPGGLLDRQCPLRRNRPPMACRKGKVMVLPLSLAAVPQGKPVAARVRRKISLSLQGQNLRKWLIINALRHFELFFIFPLTTSRLIP